MNLKRYVISSLIVFVFVFVFEWIFHGIVLKPLYEWTEFLWRPEGDCIFPAMLAAQLLFPFIFGLIYLKASSDSSLLEGFRIGLLIGILFIPTNLIFYAVQPLPAKLVMLWSLGTVLETIIAGLLFAKTYHA